MTEKIQPARVFIAPILAPAYGEWFDIDAFEDASEVEAAANRIVAAYSAEHGDFAEEWFFPDFENFLLSPGEYGGAEAVIREQELRDALENIHFTPGAFRAWAENDDWNIREPNGKPKDASDIVAHFEDEFIGVYDSLKDYVYELVDDIINLEEALGSLQYYFNYDAFARDLEVTGEVWTARVSGGTAIFRNQ